MNTFKPGIISLSALIFLAGCGGSKYFQSPLEGAFTGSFENGAHLTNLVLEDGSFWSAYTTSSGDMGGFSAGHVNAKNGEFNVTFTDFPKPGDKPVPGNGSGVYTSSSAAGSITEAGTTLKFDITKIPATNYIYKTPASITSIVGSWSGELLDGETASVDVLANGMFSGNSSNDCKFSGKFVPTDVNVFNVSVTFGGAPCALPGETASGIGFARINDNLKNQLIVAVVNAAGNVGTLFSAKR